MGRCHHSYFFHLTAAGAPPTHHFLQCSAGARSSKYCSKCTRPEILLLLNQESLAPQQTLQQPGFALFRPLTYLTCVLTGVPVCSLVAVEKAAAARAAACLRARHRGTGFCFRGVSMVIKHQCRTSHKWAANTTKGEGRTLGGAGLLPYSPTVPAGTLPSDWRLLARVFPSSSLYVIAQNRQACRVQKS